MGSGSTVQPGVRLEASLEAAIARAADRLAGEKSPRVAADDPWAEAGRKVLRFHFARMLARIPGVIAGEDPEDVHAMRVATRRMRAALRVFGDGLERDARRRHRRELRDIGGGLGAVRDLDVLIEIVAASEARASARGRAGLGHLHEAWSAEREARRTDLVRLLASKPFARFVAGHEVFTSTEGLDAAPVVAFTPSRVRTRLPAAAWSAYETVWAFDEGLERADLAALHRLRIAGKWLRYTLEFAKEALEPEAPGLIRPVVALQDHLGRQRDLHVAATLAREWAAGAPRPSGEIAAIERFSRDLEAGVDQLGRSLGRTWRPLVAPEWRRRFGRALARL